MSMFSDTAYDNVKEKIEKEIIKAKNEGKSQEFIEGLKRSLDIVYGCY